MSTFVGTPSLEQLAAATPSSASKQDEDARPDQQLKRFVDSLARSESSNHPPHVATDRRVIELEGLLTDLTSKWKRSTTTSLRIIHDLEDQLKRALEEVTRLTALNSRKVCFKIGVRFFSSSS